VAASRAATETSGRQFDMPIEFPANMRELAQDAVARTRENYEQIEIAANELGVFAESSGRIWGMKAQESCAFLSDFGFQRGLRFGIRDG